MAGNKNPAVHSVSQLQTGQLHVLTGQGYAEAGPTGAVPLLDSIVWNLAASWSHQIKTSYPDRPLGMREVTHLRTTVYFLPDGFSQFGYHCSSHSHTFYRLSSSGIVCLRQGMS